jgi:hypothetical protein
VSATWSMSKASARLVCLRFFQDIFNSVLARAGRYRNFN